MCIRDRSRTLGILHSKVPKDEQGRLFVMLELGTGLSLISLNGWHLDTLMPTLGSLLLFWFFFRFRKVERHLEFGFYASIFFVLFQTIKNIVFSMPAIEPNYPNIQQWFGFIQNAYGALMVIFAFSGFQNLAAERKNFYMEERLRSAGCIYPLCYIGAFLGYGIFGTFLQRLDRTDPKLLQCFFFLIPLGVIIVLLRLRDIRNWAWEQEVLFELKKPEKFGGGILLMLLCGAIFVPAFFRAGISLQVPKEIQIELVSPKEEEHKRAQAVRQQLEQEVFWKGKEEVLNFIPASEWLKCEGYRCV